MRLNFGKQGQSFLGARNTKKNSVTQNTESLSETSSMQMTTEEFTVRKLIMCGVRWRHETALGFCCR
jgi:hypothetical protein